MTCWFIPAITPELTEALSVDLIIDIVKSAVKGVKKEWEEARQAIKNSHSRMAYCPLMIMTWDLGMVTFGLRHMTLSHKKNSNGINAV